MYPLWLIIHKAATLRSNDFINEEGDISCIIESSASCSGFTRTGECQMDGKSRGNQKKGDGRQRGHTINKSYRENGRLG